VPDGSTDDDDAIDCSFEFTYGLEQFCFDRLLAHPVSCALGQYQFGMRKFLLQSEGIDGRANHVISTIDHSDGNLFEPGCVPEQLSLFQKAAIGHVVVFEPGECIGIHVGVAPDNYSETPAAKKGIEKIRQYFKNNPPANMHHRAMKMLASLHVDGIMTGAERRKVIKDLLALQKSDGGWGLATLGHWERSDGKEQDYESSDGYGTGFAIYVLRCAGVPAEDARIRKGIAWLKTHQRASGRWFTRSMKKDNKHYITYSGTAYAILALAACGQADALGRTR